VPDLHLHPCSPTTFPNGSPVQPSADRHRRLRRRIGRLSLCCPTALIVLKQSLIKKADNSTLVFLGLIE
jgi:hypothetical protein